MTRTFAFFGQKRLRCVALSLSLGTLGCTAAPFPRQARLSKEQPVQAIYQESAPVKRARKTAESDIRQLSYEAPAGAVASQRHESAIRQMDYTETSAVLTMEPAPPIANPACPAPFDPTCPPCEVRQLPVEQRWAAAGPNPMGPGMMQCDVCNVPSPERYPDEYLCDGGDRDAPVHYDADSRVDLDTEDTVLEYTDRAGKEHLRASNRVCIYAPRFASVRTVSRPHEGFVTSEVAGLEHLAATGGVHSRLRTSDTTKREGTGRIAVRSQASALATDVLADAVANLRRPSQHEKLINVFQSLTFVTTGILDDADTARLNLGIQAALEWTREQNPVITAKTDMAIEGRFEQFSAVITGIDERDAKAEQLRIVKLADQSVASPGDEILFTIRYDNLGGREAHHVRIVDNLTPRLEYIDDSATSDREGRLVLQDNGEGSQVLVWEITDPLPGGAGGVVTFKARVR